MQRMKFTKLSLLSQKEQRALQLNLNHDRLMLVAGNGFGKSAILKSLYETLGAKPHKIDKSWVDANVTSLVEFSLDQKSFSAMKTGSNYTLFDSSNNVLLNTNQVTSTLGPFLANLLDFHLVLVDNKEQIKTPPPSFAFAPFYIDQDSSWQKVWDSFKDFAMFTNRSKSLAEYHSGLRPNAYYKAKATRDSVKVQLVIIDAERNALHQALNKVRESIQGAPLALTMGDFVSETERLVVEGQKLHSEQAKFRTELAALNDEHQLWSDHVALVESALRETDQAFEAALKQPSDVECPMCGQHYQNEIADQFEMIADTDDLVISLQSGRAHLKEVHEKLALHRVKLHDVASSIERVDEILATHRQDISLKDVVAAQGRNEAERYLKLRLNELDVEYSEKRRAIEESERLMAESESAAHKREIQSFFSSNLQLFAKRLDVRLSDPGKLSLQGLNIGRGSEGPRALAAYYYAFLHTAFKFGTSTFCPIVIDAPNQQGQDPAHLQAIMSFLLAEAPEASQVIIGAEFPSDDTNTVIQNIGYQKDRVLRDSAYETTMEYLRPFLQKSVLN